MAWVALAQVTGFLLVVFPGRALLRRRRFGTSAPVDWSQRRAPRWYAADAGFLLGFALVVAGPLLDGLGVLGTVADLGAGGTAAGLALAAAALGLVVWTQATMGIAWRPDIAPDPAAPLVTGGPFARVRNPTYVAMLAVAAGTVLGSATAVAAAGWVLLLGALMVTARLEEAELRARHGSSYAAYLARVGRFVPGAGRVR